MKKILTILIVFIAFFSIKVYAGEVEITDIKCENLYDGVLKENISIEVQGLNITLDNTYFSKEGDYLKCSLEITNSSDDLVEVSSEEIEKLSTENIEYSLTSEGNNIIEKGKSKVYKFEASYKKVLQEDAEFENVLEIKIVNDTIKVPDTLVKSMVVLLITITSVVSVVLLIKTKNKAYLVVLIGALLILMPTAKALVNLKVTVNSKIIVEVAPRNKVYYNYLRLFTEEEAEHNKNRYNKIVKVNDGTEQEPLYRIFIIGDKTYYQYEVEELDKNYLPGEKVELKEIDTNGVEYDNCKFDFDLGANTCQKVEDYYIYGWYYDDTDIEALSFEKEELVTPNKYTMPNHDIVFYANSLYIGKRNPSVYYSFSAYLKEDEVDNYYKATIPVNVSLMSSNNDNDGLYYNNEKYIEYNVVVKEDYKPGETVEVKNFTVRYFDNCNFDESDKYICEVMEEILTLDAEDNYWYYEGNLNGMNFRGEGKVKNGCYIDNTTNEESCDDHIFVRAPKTFVMPRYDVKYSIETYRPAV